MECIHEIIILVTSIKELKDVKKDKEDIVRSNKQWISFQKDLIQKTRKKSGKNCDSLTILMEKILVLFGIDKAEYHGGSLEGNSIQTLFQNANEIFKQFLIEIKTIISDQKVVLILNDQINRYIEICILFDTFFSIARTPCGEMDDSKLNNLNEIITLCM